MLVGYKTHVKKELQCLQGQFRKQVRMTFKLVNPKYKDPVSVPNNPLSLNLLVAGLKCVNSQPIFNSRIF